MTTWIALLRGVNVNGITIRSAELAAVFRGLGFDAVQTVLASGNVRFDADVEDADRARLKGDVERALRERFSYDAWIVLITRDELLAAAAGFPFDAQDETRQPYVIFCSDARVHAELTRAAVGTDPDDDPVRAGDTVLYWNPEKGRSVDTPFAKTLAKAAYKSSTTTRNLRTLAKIVGESP